MSIFSLKRFAFQTIRPVVSRQKRGFSAHFRPGGAVLPPRVLPFSKAERACLYRPRRTLLKGDDSHIRGAIPGPIEAMIRSSGRSLPPSHIRGAIPGPIEKRRGWCTTCPTLLGSLPSVPCFPTRFPKRTAVINPTSRSRQMCGHARQHLNILR